MLEVFSLWPMWDTNMKYTSLLVVLQVNENKISTKNAFELPLIEHMDDIVDSFMGGKKAINGGIRGWGWVWLYITHVILAMGTLMKGITLVHLAS